MNLEVTRRVGIAVVSTNLTVRVFRMVGGQKIYFQSNIDDNNEIQF